MWMIHLYRMEMCYFTPKKQQVGVLEQDTELCPFLLFPSNYTYC